MANTRRTPNQNTALDPAGLENKDLATDVVDDTIDDTPKDTEPTAEPEPRMEGIEVKMLQHYTYEGKNILPGKVVELPARLAASLVTGHFAEYV